MTPESEDRPGASAGGEGVPSVRDDRPRPRYGELAPEGWTWTPPAERGREDPHPAPAAVPERPARRTPPRWDRTTTLLLLVLGILDMFLNIAVLQTAPDAIATLYARENLGTYSAADAVGSLIAAGSVMQVVLFLAAATFALLLLARHRRAFFVPLVAGVAAAVSNIAFMTVIVSTDPTLMNFYSAL